MRASSNPTGRFSSRVDAYRSARPGYPDELVELIRQKTGVEPMAGALVADVGGGTGLSAEPFLRAGYSVVGVEPNAAMREAAEGEFARESGYWSAAGTAEKTELPDRCVDLVLVAQAFHWFDGDATRREFARILRPPGWVALVWNARQLTGTPFLEGCEALLREHGTDYDAVQARTEELTAAAAPGTVPASHPLSSFFAGGWERHVLANAQTLELGAFRDRVRSASYTPDVGAPGHEAMMAAVDRLFERCAVDGRVEIRYDLVVCLGRVA